MSWFRVEIDVEDAHPGWRLTNAYWPGMDAVEDHMTYAALEAGQYVIEGGYRCLQCPGRHRPLAVFRDHILMWTPAGATMSHERLFA